MKGRILVVDDDVDMCRLLEQALRNDYKVDWRTSVQAALELMQIEQFDTVVTDLHLPSSGGLELCERVVSTRPDTPVIVLTGFGSMESAIGAIRAGAFDYLTKPVDMAALEVAVGRAVAHSQLRAEVKRLRHAVQTASRSGALIGESKRMQRLYELLDRVSDTDTTVLVTGESGTGKELVARELHARSRRAKAPFVAINCAAVPANLLESELFGHAKGAFTDAKESRDGLFVQAHGGTLFLDEIGEMPLEMQVKLLRVLQESKVRPVGANIEKSFNIRLIVATNRDLEEEVEAGRVREDLYYRINVVTIDVPPLRARGRDVLLLAHAFLKRTAQKLERNVTSISADAAQKLLDYDWPGNVRELENCIERAVTLTRNEELGVEDLPDKIREYVSKQWVVHGNSPEEFVPLRELERRYILRVLEALNDNKTQAAKILGLDRRTLYRKLDRIAEES